MNQYPNIFFLSENKCCYIVVPVKSGIRKHQSNEQESYFCSIIKKNRMLADIYVPRILNDITITVQKNHLGGSNLVHTSKNGAF